MLREHNLLVIFARLWKNSHHYGIVHEDFGRLDAVRCKARSVALLRVVDAMLLGDCERPPTLFKYHNFLVVAIGGAPAC